MRDRTTRRSRRFLAELGANVDAWYAGQIDYEAFGARQRATWDAIHAAGPAIEEQAPSRMAERQVPTRWDLVGASLCVAGAAIIVLGSR